MITLLIVLLIFFGITLWLLSIPLECDIELNTLARQKFRVQFAWMYGLITFSPTDQAPQETAKSVSAAEKHEKTKPPSKKINTVDIKRDTHFVSAMLKSEGFIKRVIKLLKDCMHIFEFKNSRLFCRLGLDNPADTGQCMGVIGPIFAMLQHGPIPDTHFEPDFDQEILIIDAGTRIRIVPIRYLGVFLLFLFSPELWRGIHSGIRARNI